MGCVLQAASAVGGYTLPRALQFVSAQAGRFTVPGTDGALLELCLIDQLNTMNCLEMKKT